MMGGPSKPSTPAISHANYAPVSLLQDFVLESLSYKSMKDREEEVAKAHGSTFYWIFDQNDQTKAPARGLGQQFTEWLESPDLGSIYWISGKAGSGKSTLMRYLYEHKLTSHHLSAWAREVPLIKAGFFFWTSGSEEQRSQVGLLRSLLHQLLSQEPDLISNTFPSLWQGLLTMSTKDRIKLSLTWSIPELMAGFHRLIDVTLPNTKICLFIDGLDEFDGDHLAIIEFFKSMSEGPNGKHIKMCLSSRPWDVFKNAFQYAVPCLKLQELTYLDMYAYVKDNLRRDPKVRRVFKKDQINTEAFFQETVRRADGVFLWIRLAVGEFLKGFRPESNVSTMQAQLNTLPSDLEELFEELLFQRQSANQLEETSRIFQSIRAREVVAAIVKDETANSPTIWELAFALDARDDVLAVNTLVCVITNEEIAMRTKSTTQCIAARSSGLLEVYAKHTRGGPRFVDDENNTDSVRRLAECKVTYLHRTVRDYLMYTKGVWKRLTERSSADDDDVFDPHLRLVRSYVLRLKFPFEEPEHHRRLDEWYPEIALSLTHSRHINHDPKRLHRQLINELNKTLDWYWRKRPMDPNDHWARNTFGSYEARKNIVFHQPFLSLTTKFGLAAYVRGELDAGILADIPADDDTTPLLAYATEFLCSRAYTIFPLSSPEMVLDILRFQSPNHAYTSFITRRPTTPWITMLRHLRDAKRRGWIQHFDVDPMGTKRWCKIIKMFLLQGNADVTAVVTKDNWDSEISAVGVIDMLWEEYGDVEVGKVRDLMRRLLESREMNTGIQQTRRDER
ncbi:putative small s protein [Phaeomoniella chlamydospora]|uniref:Putative small s protein n=1 Tax=Phaeomoniella chlamydospora TaxID=158046 RepID=A0A0G2FZ09_PHACM|nr:putative small s protein [Phaeomoniella chlamydospora]